MSTETRPQQPKTVPVVHVVYPIGILAALVISLITGWFLHGTYTDQVKAEASSMVKNVKVEVEKVESK
jgi:quinol-cytochrome oxidoreductase complex cytochrome b subunit